MRALRVVGLTEDGEVVLEDPVRLERFRVPADERLRAAARGDLSRLGQIAIELESQLRPREIQARIRAGASVEQVAAAAGVPEQKIERFAYPVLLERFRSAENAQRAHPVRTEGPDNRTLAEVVEHTFGLRGQAYEGARWDSWKGEDGRWVVALDWRAGRSHNRAHWTFQPGAHGGTVTALDEHASDLVEGLPARPLRTVGAVVDMARPEEEPAPEPSPVEQWRAAASDSYRERMPLTPEPSRSGGERGSRTTPEPWRPAPPAQRQGEREHADRPAESRTGSTRAAEVRTAESRTVESRTAEPRENGHRPAAEWTPAERGAAPPQRSAPAVPQARTEHERPDATPAVDATATPAVTSAVPPPAAAPATDASPAEATAPEGPAPTATAPPATEAAPSPTDQVVPDAAPTVTIPADGPDHPGVPADTAGRDADRSVDVPAPATEPVPTTAETQAAETQAAETQAAETQAAETQAETPAAGRRTKKGKPVMPSWDEVLLGVRGPR